MRPTVVLSLFTLILGFAAGTVADLGRPMVAARLDAAAERADAVAAAPSSLRPRRHAPPARRANLEPAVAEEDARPPSDADVIRRPRDPESVGDAPSDVPPSDVEVVRGCVVDGDGVPIPGVRVRAMLASEIDPTVQSPRSLRALCRRIAATADGSVGAAVTDLAGGSEIEVPRGVAVRLDVDSPRWSGTSDRTDRCAVRDIVAVPAGTVEVRVVLPDGSLAEEADVRWGGDSVRWTAADRTVKVACGHTGQFYAHVDGVRSGTHESIDVVQGEANEPLELRVREERGICGTLLAPRLPVACRFRVVVAADDGSDGALHREDYDRRDLQRGERYEFPIRAPGAYRILAFREDGRLVASTGVEVADGLVRADLAVHDARPDGSVVRVRLPNGNPARDVRFTLHLVTAHAERCGFSIDVDPLGDGAYRIRSAPRDALGFVPAWELSARTPDHRMAATATIDWEAAGEVVLDLVRPDRE